MAKKSYDHLSREDLIALLKKRDSERKLGLVWERDEIEHEAALNNDFVALDLVPELSAGNAPYRNMIIEGDNFDALRYLGIAYKGRVKAIYVDVPYNTGGDLLYNDHYIDKDDRYRQSTWLEFLYQRFLLARDLLANDGVLMVSINDENRSKLELMLDQVYPGMRAGSFAWKCRSGGNDTKGALLSSDHEHVLVYRMPKFSFKGEGRDEDAYSNPDGDPRGDWANDNLVKAHNAKQRPEAYYTIHNPESDTYYLCDPDSVWRFSSTSRPLKKRLQADPIEVIIKEKRILWPGNAETVTYSSVAQIKAALADGTAPKQMKIYLDLPKLKKLAKNDDKVARLLEYIEPMEAWVGRKIGFGKPRYKRFRSNLLRDVTPVSSWMNPAADGDPEDDDEEIVLTVGTTAEGTLILKNLIGSKDFPYPKPLSLMKGIIGQATGKDDIVLDFFAGSATTAHATIELNKDDGGSRSFIMVSSTEATKKEVGKNLCRDVTARRMKAVGADFAYLRAQRIPMARLHTDISHDQIWTALQQMHAGVITRYDAENALHCLDITDTDLFYVAQLTPDVVDALSRRSEHRKPAVIYSWQPGVLQQRLKSEHFAFEKIPNFLVERFGGAQ
jgi:adenine-specific DNA-methyltransferase